MQTIKELIKLFEATPDDQWNVGSRTMPIDGKTTHCALGWAETFGPDHYTGLIKAVAQSNIPVVITKKVSVNGYSPGDTFRGRNEDISGQTIAAISNGETAEYQQPTPKERTLAYLHDLDKELVDA